MKDSQTLLRKISDPSSMTAQERAYVLKIFERFTTPIKKDVGVSQKLLENMYAVAHNFYRAGDYEKSAKLFHGLCVLDHLDARFWKGLGASRHMKGHLKSALEAYTMAMMLKLEDADVFLHASECLIALGFFEPARETLKRCLQVIQMYPKKFEYLQNRAESLAQALQRKMKLQKTN